MRKAFSIFLMLSLADCMMAAGFPDPKVVGFRNCALIYEQENRGVEELRHYVAAPGKDGSPRWGFDAFLFLTLYHKGEETSYMKSDKALWEHWLDRYFRPGKDIAALDQAVESFGKAPPEKRKVIITIPWMSDEVTEFGDVDNDGVTENLAQPVDRAKVARWYIDLVAARFKAQNYRHLELWGFYWMREDLIRDKGNAKLVSAIVKEKGYKLLWIPYYYAAGWEQWRELGMDVAILQTSYPFYSWIDGGRARPNRIAAAADAARAHGLGIEIEGRGLKSPAERRMFRQMLSAGKKSEQGYQSGAQAYFLSYNVVERLARSSEPDEALLYNELIDYLNGREVKLDHSREPAQWTIRDGARPFSVVAEAALPQPGVVALLDLFFKDADSAAPWLGQMEVFVKERADGGWLPAGWAIGGNQDSYDGKRNAYERGFRNLTAPVGGRPVVALRAVITGQRHKLENFKLHCDFFGPQLAGRGNLAYRKPYETTLPKKTAVYSDNPSTNKLIDGVTSSRDYTAYMGWEGNPEVCFVALRLGDGVAFDEVRIHTRGGTQDAVNFPVAPCLVLSDTAPFLGLDGIGAIPEPNPLILDYQQLVTTETISPYCRLGYMQFKLPEARSFRHLGFSGEVSGWLMLSEIELLYQGKTLKLENCTYSVRPAPTVHGRDSNSVNGIRLTDGIIAERAWFAPYYGWQGDGEQTFTIDLEEEKTFREAAAYFVKDIDYGVVPPKAVSFAFSRDGQTWSSERPATGDEPATRHGVAKRILAVDSTTARYVRVRVKGADERWAWTMMSEIEIR